MLISIQLITTGLIATLFMSLLLFLFKKFSSIESDMETAIGSFFTKIDDQKSKNLGRFIHIGVGIAFAILYQLVWSMFPFETTNELLAVGLVVGFAHGLVFSILLVVSVAEQHPLARFRKASFAVAIVHWGAHMVYGGVLGLSASYTQQEFNTLSKVAGIMYDNGVEINRPGFEIYAQNFKPRKLLQADE